MDYIDEDVDDYNRGDDEVSHEAEAITEIEEMKEIDAEVEKSQSLSERFRKELEGYLEELDQKTTSEGEALIDVPENFDTIVQSMTREDLMETEKKKTDTPWYEYIIRDHVNKKLEKDFKGRYHNIIDNSEDEHIRKGMAEILMLDRQLWMLSKKAQVLAADDENNDDHNRRFQNNSSSKRNRNNSESTPNTPGSRKNDRTFITKLGIASSPPKTGSTIGDASSRQRPRSGFLSSRRTTPRGQTQPQQQDPTNDNDTQGRDDETQGDESQESMKHALKQSKMSEQEQAKRLAELLALDDTAFDQTMPAYYSEELQAKNKEIDEQLEGFGHLDRLQSNQSIEEELKYIDSKDYLTQQRLERKRQQHTSKIDNLLSTYGSYNSNHHNKISDMSSTTTSTNRMLLDADLSSLVAMARQEDSEYYYNNIISSNSSNNPSAAGGGLLSPQSTRSESRSMYNSQLHEIPASIDDIRPDVPITREDIHLLVENLRAEHARKQCQKSYNNRTKITGKNNNHEEEEETNKKYENEDDNDDEDDLAAMSAKTSPRSSRPVTASSTTYLHTNTDPGNLDDLDFEQDLDEHTKQRINDLLQYYAQDIQRLSHLRASSRISARLMAGESLTIPSSAASASSSSRPLSSASTPFSSAAATSYRNSSTHDSVATKSSNNNSSKKGSAAATNGQNSSRSVARQQNAPSASTTTSRGVTTTIQQQKKKTNVSATANNTSSNNTNSENESGRRRSAKSHKSGQMLFASDHHPDTEQDGDYQSLPLSVTAAAAASSASEYSPPRQINHSHKNNHDENETAFSRSDLQMHPDFVEEAYPTKSSNSQQNSSSSRIYDLGSDNHEGDVYNHDSRKNDNYRTKQQQKPASQYKSLISSSALPVAAEESTSLPPSYTTNTETSFSWRMRQNNVGSSNNKHSSGGYSNTDTTHSTNDNTMTFSSTQAAAESAEADRQLAQLAAAQQRRQQEIAALQEEREKIWQSLLEQADRLDSLQQHSVRHKDNEEDNSNNNSDKDDDGDGVNDETNNSAIAQAAKAATAAAMARIMAARDEEDQESGEHDTFEKRGQQHENADADFEIESDDNHSDNDDNYHSNKDRQYHNRRQSNKEERKQPTLKLPRISSATSTSKSLGQEPSDYNNDDDEESDEYFYQKALQRLDVETQRAMQRSMQPSANNPRIKQPSNAHSNHSSHSASNAEQSRRLMASPPPATQPSSTHTHNSSGHVSGRRHIDPNSNTTNANSNNTVGTGSNVAIMRATLLNQVREYVEI